METKEPHYFDTEVCIDCHYPNATTQPDPPSFCWEHSGCLPPRLVEELDEERKKINVDFTK